MADEKEATTEQSAEKDTPETASANTEVSSDRVVYELGYHFIPTVGEEGLPQEVAALKGQIEKLGGTFVAEEFPTHITLAYTMIRSRGGTREKFASAYFGWIKFESDSEHAEELRVWLDNNERVLRYLLFKTVREDTRAPKRATMPQQPPAAPIRPKLTSDTKKSEEPQKPVSEAELDKTIDELVVE